MPHYKKLVGEKCYLSPCAAEDAEKWAVWDNDPEVALPLGDEWQMVMLGVFSFNERAIACYRKIGFREIGRWRQARIIAGKCYDMVFMDMLAEEFRVLKA